jgi:hypothetical protein
MTIIKSITLAVAALVLLAVAADAQSSKSGYRDPTTRDALDTGTW